MSNIQGIIINTQQQSTNDQSNTTINNNIDEMKIIFIKQKKKLQSYTRIFSRKQKYQRIMGKYKYSRNQEQSRIININHQLNTTNNNNIDEKKFIFIKQNKKWQSKTRIFIKNQKYQRIMGKYKYSRNQQQSRIININHQLNTTNNYSIDEKKIIFIKQERKLQGKTRIFIKNQKYQRNVGNTNFQGIINNNQE